MDFYSSSLHARISMARSFQNHRFIKEYTVKIVPLSPNKTLSVIIAISEIIEGQFLILDPNYSL